MVGQALHALIEGEAHLRREVGLKAEALQVMQEELDTLQTEVQVVRERFLQTEKDLALVTDDLKGRVQELEDALRRVTEERDTLQAKFDLPLWSPSRWSK
jgi:predicted  nucleic acid-binding Zn-ribbon protein